MQPRRRHILIAGCGYVGQRLALAAAGGFRRHRTGALGRACGGAGARRSACAGYRPRSRPPRRDDSGAARSGGDRLSHAAAGARRERLAPRPVPASGHGAAPHIRLHEHDRRLRRHGRRCRGRKQPRAAAYRSRAPPRQCRRNDASLVQRAARAPRRAARAGDLWAGSPAARAVAARRASRARARGRHEQPHPRRRSGRSLRRARSRTRKRAASTTSAMAGRSARRRSSTWWRRRPVCRRRRRSRWKKRSSRSARSGCRS